MMISLAGEQLASSEGMAALTAVGVAMADAFDDDVTQIVRELNVSEKCAADIAYLRTRSRHTAQLEQRLIDMHKAGIPVNVFDFPYGYPEVQT